MSKLREAGIGTTDVANPPEIKLPEGADGALVELILWNYKLRVAVAAYRKKWLVADHFNADGPLIEKATRLQMDAELRAMLDLFNPGLPDVYFGLICAYAEHNLVQVSPPVLLDEPNNLSKLYNQIVEADTITAASFEIDTGSVRDGGSLSVRIHAQLTKSELKQLSAAIERAGAALPKRLRYRGSHVRLLSKIADYRRAGLKHDQISAALEGAYNETYVRQLSRDAERLGL